MAEEKPNGEAHEDEQDHGKVDRQWEHFKDTLGKLAQVPKEELNEKLAEREREKKEEKRAG